MPSFIHDDFLLHSRTGKKLYHEVAAELPIIDYHSHLPPGDIAGNRQFKNLYEVWLEGDHYKWRAMRSNGIDEAYCTGDAAPYEKFLAFARTVPKTMRNPLFHWTHLELKRYFGIGSLLNEETAPSVWAEANEKLASEEFRVHGLLSRMNVETVCTTDDPVDALEDHQKVASSDAPVRMFPTYRPDAAMGLKGAAAFGRYLKDLEAASGIRCRTLSGMLEALKNRHDYFHSHGGRLSDHGLTVCPAGPEDEEQAESAFRQLLAGEEPTPGELESFRFYQMVQFGRWDAAKDWTKQLHLGAMRNNNTRLFNQLGPDTGFDSIGDYQQGERLSRLLDRLDQTKELPRTILYNLNPSDNYLMGTMIGNFQDGSVAGKIQFGSGWWFLDQKEGMEWQMNALSSLGLLSRFVGMLTDSRSFLSFPRHEYFRRILCELVGRDVDNGELPDDGQLLNDLIEGVCYRNAREFFDFPI